VRNELGEIIRYTAIGYPLPEEAARLALSATSAANETAGACRGTFTVESR